MHAWGSSRRAGQGKDHGCVPPAELTFQQRLREVTGYLQQGLSVPGILDG